MSYTPVSVGLEPDELLHAGHHVLLDAQVGQEEAVQHVLALDRQHDLFVHRHVQVVDEVHVVVGVPIMPSSPA